MSKIRLLTVCALVAAAGLGLFASRLRAQNPQPAVPEGRPDAVVDLMTTAGVDLVKGAWRYSDTKIIEVDFRTPRPENRPIKTYSYTPHADQVAKKAFDDAAWPVLDPATLKNPRSTGKLCFNWYRTRVTIPEKVGEFDTTGSTVVFDTIVDDYGEVYVNGSLNHRVGQRGGSVVAGFNAPNRLVIGRDVKPGDEIQLAIFGINSPLGDTPNNYIFLRYARLEFYKKAP